jgi:bifunctional DNase/RNase
MNTDATIAIFSDFFALRVTIGYYPEFFVMSGFTCNASGCVNQATVHTSRIQSRVTMEERWFCQAHLDEFLSRHYVNNSAAPPLTHELNDLVEVDLDLLVYDQTLFHEERSCWVYLRQFGSGPWFALPIGFFECSNLEWELRHHRFNRPPTHHMISHLIDEVGGRLVSATIDHYQEGEQIFDSKLCIALRGKSITIDARPSDAILLAVVCQAPIYVAGSVWQEIIQ